MNSHETRILILTVHHGSSHVRMAQALEQALMQVRPSLKVEVVDALAHCTAWFRAYYNSFELPLKYWPGLWEYIESHQHRGASTGPLWLYRWGARPLFRFIETFAPEIVIATEVGLGEMTALHKRQTRATYALVGVCPLDFDRPWAQWEFDLFLSSPGEIAAQMKAAGVPSEKICECGMPVDQVFTAPCDIPATRARLGLEGDLPVLLVNFGGSGKRKPREVVGELRKIQRPLQIVFLSRRNESLYQELRRLTAGMQRTRVLPWVDNLHEWMAVADLLVSRAGGSTTTEALNSHLPMLVFDAPPGDERRLCQLIETTWQTGYWVKGLDELVPRINQLLNQPEELARLRTNTMRHARPHAARGAAETILKLCD
jgi:processive 1,2-diacylglycerol beta-glucosyltransferase